MLPLSLYCIIATSAGLIRPAGCAKGVAAGEVRRTSKRMRSAARRKVPETLYVSARLRDFTLLICVLVSCGAVTVLYATC
jgi:hypothetical protein